MKKVSVENIQFIQNYLKNSGVEYDDVLAEMTDHVASEIEMCLESENELFYDVFKNYMAQHKKALLNNVKKFRRRASKRALGLVLKNLLNPTVLVSSFIIGLILFFLPVSLAENMMFILLEIMILEAFLLIFMIRKQTIISYKKFSCLERLAAITAIFNYFYVTIFKHISSEDYAFTALIIFVVLNASFLVSSIQLAKYYRKNYQLS